MLKEFDDHIEQLKTKPTWSGKELSALTFGLRNSLSIKLSALDAVITIKSAKIFTVDKIKKYDVL